ncbi:hypothetical protein niasHT_032538 [Heterodera trifolii]|uniref:CXXC-type zinc finger protein 1 n=1 Tax=Heterodera trifolii TaxID=157864 RepID=A0ABD2I0F2_9BILA
MANTKKHSKKKEDDGEAEEKHCICDSKDYSTLMICCDYCLIWYHVECVKVTETQAKIFKKFACHFCTAKDPSCVTLHKKWAKGVVMSKHRGSKSGGSAKNKESNAGKEKKGERETKSGGTEKRRRERERSGESSSKTAATTTSSGGGGGARKSNRTKTDGEESEETRRATPEANAVPPTVPPPMTAQQKHQLELQEANPNLRCKNCIGCFREKNCGKCFTCCASTTTTTSDDARCCTARICVQVEELLKQQQKMPSSSSAAVDGKTSEETEGEENGGEKRTTAQQMADGRGERRGGSSKKKGRKPKADKRHRQNQTTAQQQQQQRKHHRHGGHGTMTAEEQQQATNVQLLRAYENLLRRRQNNANSGGGGGVEGGGTSSRGNRIAQEDLHCHGPGCTNSARVGSKYCSENCGIELAKRRLRLILPQRFNAFFGEAPHTQTENNAHIERIQEQMADINIRLDELDQWKNNVHQFMVVLKSNTFVDNGTTIAMDNDGIAMEQQSTTTTTKRSPNGGADANRDDGDGGNDCHAAENGSEEKKPTMMTAVVKNEDENMLVGCPVCHGEFQMREICKHVHTCFVRSERQTTYGTDYQIPNNQYNLYCEAYNKIDGTFCKRLRYACAEHYRDEYGLEVCGCPLGWYKGNSLQFRAMFAASSQQQQQEEEDVGGYASALSFGDEGFCRQKQKNCRDHKNWAQTAFSLIDNERLNLLNKFDELCEQRRHLQLKLLQRGDILSLFCNNSEPSSSTPITN